MAGYEDAPLQHTTGPERVGGVLVADGSREGAAVCDALRAAGFLVVETTAAQIEALVLAEPPRVVIASGDDIQAVAALERLRELPVGIGVEMVLLGEPHGPGGAAAHGLSAFPRPIDATRLVDHVGRFADPSSHHSAPTRPPPTQGARHSFSPAAEEVDHPSQPPGSPDSDPLDPGALLPAEDAGGGPILAGQFSPELRALLEGAELRVADYGGELSMSPDDLDSVEDIPAPADLLASLDEPLDPVDGAGTGASSGGGTPMHSAPGQGSAVSAIAHGTSVLTPPPAARPPSPPTDTPPSVAEARMDPSPARFPPAPSVPGLGAYLRGRATEVLTAERAGTVSDSWAGGAPRSVAPATIALSTEGLPHTAPPPRPSEPAPLARDFGTARPEPLPPPPPPPPASSPGSRMPPQDLPSVLGEGDAARTLARAIAARASGSLALSAPGGLRRIVLHEGDVVTASSGLHDESLLAFLAARGDIDRSVVARLDGKIPAYGRHAGAALIAHGYLGQDDLWPVLRAHAEWILGHALGCDVGTCELESEPPGRLKAEPNVFGGATGGEVFVEAMRRLVDPELAVRRLGGPGARLADGPEGALLSECALPRDEEALVRAAPARTVGEICEHAGADVAPMLYALVCLGILEALAPAQREPSPRASTPDPLDDEALRQRVGARVALVRDGDYFALLGVGRAATGYELRRAYLELRRAFEPARVLTPATADLAEDMKLVIEVLDEAYEILREPQRRERYRRAIEAGPPV